MTGMFSMRPLSNPGPLRGVGRRACSALAARKVKEKDGQTWAHDFWWEKFGGLMSKTSKPRNFWIFLGLHLETTLKQSYDPVGRSLQEINAINKAEFCIWSWPLGTLPLVLVKHAFEHWGTPSWAPIVHIPTEATKHMHVQFYIQSRALFCLPNKWF